VSLGPYFARMSKSTFTLVVAANYSGARALRNGMLEICIIPANG
jgi:hypothetical protein